MLQHARDSVGGVYYKIVVFTTVARRVTTLLNQPEWTVDGGLLPAKSQWSF